MIKPKGKRSSFCVISKWVSRESYLKDPDHERHCHIGWKELRDLHDQNFLQPIAEGLDSTDISYGRVEGTPDYIFEWVTGSAIRFKRHVPTRGLSSKFGEYLAAAIKAKEAWALVMAETMRAEMAVSGCKPSLDQYDAAWL